QENMKVLLRLICFIALLMSSLEADNCMERESIIHVVSSADEIDVRTCPLNPNEDKGTISWYKNDSKIPLPMDPVSRIRQREDNLWFIPAKVEDSGYYYCVVRNASHCLRIKVTVEFVENDPDLCFNTQARFAQRLPVAGDGKIVCPYLDYFKDENNELPKIQWYKDCKPFPLDETCFSGVADKLIVSNVAEEHRGNYTCRTSYTYLGKQYHVSRVIELITVVPDFQNHVIGAFVMLTVIIICSVFIYKIFKVDIVLWYRDSCYDFLPPKDIVEVTNANIKKSRRLIIILVREILGFGWLGNSSEEQIAMYNALIQDGIKVVLLELEKIQDYEKMPESIQFIKQKHGAIRWSGDFREGPQTVKTRFWKNVRDRDSCYRIQVNLTVFEKYWCDPTRRNPPHLSDEYKQILHVGNDSLTCHLHFPKSYIVDSVKWYKDCKEIKEKRFTPLRVMLLVNNVTAKDRGNYACQATLTHLGKRYMVLNSITVNVTKRIDNGGRIPKIIYPKNNSIEVQPVPDFRAYLIGGFIALTVTTLSVVCVYNLFKIDIVLWYRSAFPSTRNTEDGKLYDAYVLYPKPQRESQSHDVEKLVLEILPEVLERQCGYKLFIFGRDEFPGQAVATVIDDNIKLCRRLIVIIVPESLSFSLLKNMSEEQIAVYNALIQDGMKVILIELERIEDYTAMPESIQYIKQKHGSIQWSGDFTEQSQCAKTKFWKRVRYHMPPQGCSASSDQLLKHKS
ncbi:Interleukin-1 receptor-like 2, partial [Tupaia chinensis]